MPHSYTFPADVHFKWDSTLDPVLTVESGDTVHYELQEATSGQVTESSTHSDIPKLDWDKFYGISGPLAVVGAKPGDTLEIEILDLQPLGWGWTGVFPGLGLLSDDFPDEYLHIWDLSDRHWARFHDIAAIPIRPFCGTMGVCPQTSEPTSILPPGHFGGNMDCRELVAGSSLFLPVQIPGAQFSVGDPHAAQGHGEVCMTAIEAPMSHVALRFVVHKGKSIRSPQVRTAGPPRGHLDDAGYEVTTGVEPDLMEASRSAVRSMIDHLCATYPIEPIDAYLLCSVVVDLRIIELVDRPNWVVGAYLPRAVCEGAHSRLADSR